MIIQRSIAVLVTLVLALAGAIALVQPASAAARLSLPPSPRVLLEGDSYTEGVGSSTGTAGYAPEVARNLGWRMTRDGRGGSGYCNPTNYGAGVFGDRLYDHPADAYDLVVIQGSSNDAKVNAKGQPLYSDAELAGAYNRTIRAAKARYPSAQLVLVGPTNPYGNYGTNLRHVNAKLKAAAAYADVLFVDAIAEQWFVPGDGSRYAATSGAGKGHPNDAGYHVYAERLTSDLQGLGA